MAQIQKGTTYSTGDQVTAANLNALADAAILLPGAITDQTAKTVPLAADTILLHSAADTALRKSTLTQLFSNATGIPISTGISGLGTGIATALAINTGSAGAPVLFNGALGTPSSGTVTNLTGTASININGTVGATTPNTVVATTGTFTATGQVQYFSGATTASKYIRLENTGGNSYFGIEGATPAFGGTAYAAFLFAPSEIDMLVGSVKVGAFTATGLNSTPIGVTTASTGAFTTLATSGNMGIGTSAPSASAGYTTLQIDNATNGGVINLAKAGTVAAQIYSVGINATISTIQAGSTLTINPYTNSIFQIAGSEVGRFSSTGLAVTGSVGISGSGTFSTTSNGLNLYGIDPTGYRIGFDNVGGTVGYIRHNIVAGGTTNTWGHVFSTSQSGTPNTFTNSLFVGASGNVGIGTTIPQRKLSVSNGGAGGFEFGPSNTSNEILNFNRSTSQYIESLVYASNHTFYAGSGGGVRAVDITSSGNLLVGTSSFSYNPNNGVTLAGDSIGAVGIGHASGTATGNGYANFAYAGSNIGSITQTGTTAVLYNTTSDYRLKEITGPLTDSGTFIDSLKPKIGTWKADGSKFVGFVAHEFAEVSPSSVTGEKDAVDSDGKPIYQAMQASSAEVIANLVAELQSLRQRVAALESN